MPWRGKVGGHLRSVLQSLLPAPALPPGPGWVRVAEYERHKPELRELERENSELKRMVAEQALDIRMLKDLNSKKW